mgnify:CR=1 FL=1
MAKFINNIKIAVLAVLFRMLYGSCRWQVNGLENIEKVVKEDQSAILAYWHGNMLIPYYKLAKFKFHILAGFHRDAELGVQIGQKLGWRFFRGSSSKRGSEVFQDIVDFLSAKGRVVVFTPDGPKGPAKIPKPGTVRAAQKSGVPVIPIAGRSRKSWGFTNWDTFHVTKPFTKIVLNIGKPMYFTDEEGFDVCNNRLTSAFNEMEEHVKEDLAR